jgi:hypothetical protein
VGTSSTKLSIPAALTVNVKKSRSLLVVNWPLIAVPSSSALDCEELPFGSDSVAIVEFLVLPDVRPKNTDLKTIDSLGIVFWCRYCGLELKLMDYSATGSSTLAIGAIFAYASTGFP